MEEVEKRVEKNMILFCKMLPSHVDNWKCLLMECKNYAMALSNLAEQLRHVESTKLEYMENFTTIQNNLQFSILNCIEEDLLNLKTTVAKVNFRNHDFRTKLGNFESSTLQLDWSSNSEIVRGSPTQPRLDKLLQLSYECSLYFSKVLKNINNHFKSMDVRSERSMTDLEKSFDVDLDVKVVNDLLAVTQYVDKGFS